MNISPEDLAQKIHGAREIEERSKRIGVFSRTQNPQFVRTHDSRGLALGHKHRNHSKEFIKPRNQGLDSSKHESSKREEIKTKTQRRRERTSTQHTKVNLNRISFINFGGIHLYKARAIRPSSTL